MVTKGTVNRVPRSASKNQDHPGSNRIQVLRTASPAHSAVRRELNQNRLRTKNPRTHYQTWMPHAPRTDPRVQCTKGGHTSMTHQSQKIPSEQGQLLCPMRTYLLSYPQTTCSICLIKMNLWNSVSAEWFSWMASIFWFMEMCTNQTIHCNVADVIEHSMTFMPSSYISLINSKVPHES